MSQSLEDLKSAWRDLSGFSRIDFGGFALKKFKILHSLCGNQTALPHLIRMLLGNFFIYLDGPFTDLKEIFN
jgi:hypothetical protein